ncbi:MAG: hypothetical protein SWN10_20550 [Pseudomonadota bacterium]|nr:hypothetical protein [Pseudomonadota bacterium]
MRTIKFDQARIEVNGKILADSLVGEARFYMSGNLKTWDGYFSCSDFSLFENRENKFLVVPGVINGVVVFTNFNGNTFHFKGSGDPTAGGI